MPSNTITLSLMGMTLVRFVPCVQYLAYSSDCGEIHDPIYIGRNALVANAVGITNFGGVTYSTTAKNISGLLAAGSTG